MTTIGLFRLKTSEVLGEAQGTIDMVKNYDCPICNKRFYLGRYRNGLWMEIAVCCHMRHEHPEVVEAGFGGHWSDITGFNCPKRAKPDRRTTEQLLASEPIGMGNWYMENERKPEQGRFLMRLQILKMNSKRVVMKTHEGNGLVIISPPSFVEVEMPPCDMTPSIKADERMKVWIEARKAESAG